MRRLLLSSILCLLFSVSCPLPSVAAAPYAANWSSLDARPMPAWYLDAKFGVFIHWGVYSVPAWGKKGEYAEWYWRHVQSTDPKDAEWQEFHAKNYGKDFPYQDFAPRFTAELFDARQWASLFARAGVKYVVPTSKHHEGFALWPSADASRTWGRPWNAVEIGQVDVVLVVAHEPGLRTGEQRRAFIDLIEGIRHHHQRLFAAVRDCLRGREEGFARAVDRQDHRFRIDRVRGQTESAGEPVRNRLPERLDAERQRVRAQCRKIRRDRIEDECRRRVARFADVHGDRREMHGRLRAGEQRAQALERIRLQPCQRRLHVGEEIADSGWRIARDGKERCIFTLCDPGIQ